MAHAKYFESEDRWDSANYLGMGMGSGLESNSGQSVPTYSYFNWDGASRPIHSEEGPMAATMKYEEPRRNLERREFDPSSSNTQKINQNPVQQDHQTTHEPDQVNAASPGRNKYRFDARSVPPENGRDMHEENTQRQSKKRYEREEMVHYQHETTTSVSKTDFSGAQAQARRVDVEEGRHRNQTHSVQHDRQPTLEEVQARIRQVDLEHRNEARRRLQVSEDQKKRAAIMQRQKAEAATFVAQHRQAADFTEYSSVLGRVGNRPVPHESSVMAAAIGGESMSRAPSQHGRAEEYNVDHHRLYVSRYGGSATLGGDEEERVAHHHHHHRSYSQNSSSSSLVMRSSAHAITTDDPLLPVGKRIDPSDVYFKPVQGKLQAIIENRNNSRDVESYSRFHPTAATAAAGGRHEGIVSAAAPSIPKNLMRSSSASRSRSVTSYGNTTLSSVEAYTREVEAAQVRRLKGQAAIIAAHQVGDPRAVHYDPLMVVRPVEWRDRDMTVLHGTLPRATLLRQQHNERKLRELRQGNNKGGGLLVKGGKVSRTFAQALGGENSKAQMMRKMTTSAPNTFGTSPSKSFAAHPMGFADLPTRSKRSADTSFLENHAYSGSSSPAARQSPPPSPRRPREGEGRSASAPSPAPAADERSPRYVLPSTSKALFTAVQPAVGSTGMVSNSMVIVSGRVQSGRAAQEPTPGPAYTIETASTVTTSDAGCRDEVGSIASETKRLAHPSHALLTGEGAVSSAIAESISSTQPIKPHETAELPRRSKRAPEGARASSLTEGGVRGESAKAATEVKNHNNKGQYQTSKVSADHADVSEEEIKRESSGEKAKTGGGERSTSDPFVLELLERQSRQQEQIERLLKAQEALLRRSQNREDEKGFSKSRDVTFRTVTEIIGGDNNNNNNKGDRGAIAVEDRKEALQHMLPSVDDPARYSYHYRAALTAGTSPQSSSRVTAVKYVSPSRSLLAHEYDSPSTTPGDQAHRQPQPQTLLSTHNEGRGPSVPSHMTAHSPNAFRPSSLPHPWWERHSPDAHAPPPQQRDRTSSPTYSHATGGAVTGIAAAFASAVAAVAGVASSPRSAAHSAEPQPFVGGYSSQSPSRSSGVVASVSPPIGAGRAAYVDDEVLNTALSPLSEQGDESKTPSPAPSAKKPTALGRQSSIDDEHSPAPSAVPRVIPVPIPQAVFDSSSVHKEQRSGDRVGEAEGDSNAATNPFSSSSIPQQSSHVGAIAQLFRSQSQAATTTLRSVSRSVSVGGASSAGASSTSAPIVVRNDLFKPKGASLARGREGHDAIAVRSSSLSFREAFDKGAPLPYERPAGSLSPEQQQVSYYASEDTVQATRGVVVTHRQRPSSSSADDDVADDPATALLMQMAGQRRAMAV